jgi:tocopherol O-methyltransferase
MTYETRVREFYDTAGHCYETFMGDRWHHGDPEAEARGATFLEACQILERKVASAAGLDGAAARDAWALDFGCGIGGPTLHMAKVTGASFVGVSNNEGLNTRARAKAAEQGLADRVRFLTIGDTDYKNLPFPACSFDAVTFFESVCHLPDKARFFEEVARVLRPGGRVAGTDWIQRPFGPHRTEQEILELMQPVNETICIPAHGTIESYRRLLEASGLRVLVARDIFEGVLCWGSTPEDQRDQWLAYDGPNSEQFRLGKKALDAARAAGVFSAGMFVASKPMS